MFWNGSTANDGLSGSGGPAPGDGVATSAATKRHRCSKAIATPANSLDAASPGSRLVENPAKCGNLHVEIAVFDRGPGPDRSDDLGPQNELARPLDQHTENVERPGTHRQWCENAVLILSEQDADPPVETELAEEPDIGRGRCVHAVARCVSPNFQIF
jgi:hypothetical protein